MGDLRVGVLSLAALVLASCEQAPADVYAMPLPNADDIEEMRTIRDGLRPADDEVWGRIMMMRANPMAAPIRAATVGEAITNMRAQMECRSAATTIMDANPPSSDRGYIARYNAGVDAYNRCKELPL